MSYVYFTARPIPKTEVCIREVCVRGEAGPAWLLAGAAIALGTAWVVARL